MIGSLYFSYKDGLKILDTACSNMMAWPLPDAEGAVTLPLLGDVIRVVLSPKNVPPSASILLPRGLPPSSHSDAPSRPKMKRMVSENGYQLVEKHATHSAGGCFQEVPSSIMHS